MRLLFLPLVLGCPLAIDYMEPPICTPNSQITPLGVEKTYQYANMLFESIYNILDTNQRECILQGPSEINQVIRTCISELTINEETIPHKVAQGLAKKSTR